MTAGKVDFKNAYASQFKSEVANVFVFEWSEEEFRWVSEKQNDDLIKIFSEEDGVAKAVEKGLLHEGDVAEMTELLNSRENSAYLERIIRMNIKKGDFYWKKVSINNFYNESGKCVRFIVVVLDIDNIVSRYEKMQYRVEYDTLTDIYNVEKFYELVSEKLNKYPDQKYALIRMDIDRFKLINDMFGIEEGNRLLVYMSDIIRQCKKPGYLYCRVNSDVFCLCIPYENKQEIIALVRSLEDKIESYEINYKLVPAFGILQIKERNVPVSVMLDWAKLASKSIKGSLFSNYAFYNNELRSKMLRESEIENYMSKALSEHQFKTFLQPKYNISTSEIVGAEVLCRWQHPQKGFLTPSEFIPLFEKNGFIIQLDYYMWEESFKLIRRWLDEGRKVMTVSLNVSRMHVYNFMFEKQMSHLMEKYKIPPNLLELELTETAFLENENEMYQLVLRLKNLGFRFSIDDFGTGYSSLNMLKSVPIDILKLDRGFLNETSVSSRGKEIIRYTIAMARQLNLQVIAEGVETVEQAEFLLKTGCDTAQGYYYCKPVSVDEFEKRAFSDEMKLKPEDSIRKVVSGKNDLMDEMRQIQDTDIMQGFFDNGAFTYDEMNTIHSNFMRILRKYRSIILAENVIFYEFDLERDKMITSYHKPEFEPERPIANYFELISYLIYICSEKDKMRIKKKLSMQNLQNLLDENIGEMLLDYRVNTRLRNEVWIRTTIVLDADKNGILDTLLICSTDIDELKRVAAAQEGMACM